METSDASDSHELTLSERVAWMNSYERSLIQAEDGVVLEIDVYPIDGPTDRDGRSIDTGLITTLRNAVTSNRPPGRGSRRRS